MTHRNRKELALAIAMILMAILCRIFHPARLFAPLAYLRSLLYILLYSGWIVSVRRRVIQPIPKTLLTHIGILALCWMILRTVKFSCEGTSYLTRHLWYLYYVPMLLIPTLFTLLAISVGKPERWHFRRWAKWTIVFPLLLATLIFLNDRHQLAFVFTTPEPSESSYTYGIVYWLAATWICVCGLSGLYLLIEKCRQPYERTFLIVPFIPMGILALYAPAYFLRVPWVFSIAGDITAFMCLFFTATAECCIQCGLIRSNTGYEELFEISGVNAFITDENYNVRLYSDNVMIPSKEEMKYTKTGPVVTDKGLRLSSAPIRNGHVFWMEDISELLDMLNELEDDSSYLEDKRRIMQKEYETSLARQRSAEKNRLYNKIMTKTESEIERYAKLVDALEQTEDPVQMNYLVSRIALTCTYIKRRDNLIFLDEYSDTKPALEMRFCLQETMNAILLCGVGCGFSVNIEDEGTIGQMADLYEQFYTVVRTCLDSLSSLFVYVNAENGYPVLVLNLKCAYDLSQIHLPNGECEYEDGDWTVTIRCKEECL